MSPRSAAAHCALLTFACLAGCGDDRVLLPERSRDPATVVDGSPCEDEADGAPCGQGMFCLAERCAEARCGDGVRTGREGCDDGNVQTGDGCDPACRVEPAGCGNGVVDADEECDDGNWFERDRCSTVCTLNVCGNGRVDVDEECDDGNRENGDACSVECEVVACRNGRVEPGEECDDGNTVDRGDGCTNACRTSVCGNGVLEKYESCDDGNLDDGDGCPRTCTLAVCGNRQVDVGEACDGARIAGYDRVTSQPGQRLGCADDCTRTVDDDACERCQEQVCRNYLGVDLVGGCFARVNPDFGADPNDPEFIQRCIDVVNCALANDCGMDGADRGDRCYCGSAPIDVCASNGPANDAPCVAEWRAAARTDVNAEVQLRFRDPAFASGFAYSLLDCYGNPAFCGDVCSVASP